MARPQRTLQSTESRVDQVGRLALILFCLLAVACGPPPPSGPGPGATLTAPGRTLAGAGQSTRLVAPTDTPRVIPDVVEPAWAPLPGAGELSLALRESIKTLNPFLTTSTSEAFVVRALYDTLADDAQGELNPNLAERWEVSPDGTRLICWLNPTARWHDGQPVGADDVAFTFDLIRQTAFPGWARRASLVGRVEAMGPAQVQFTLLRPSPDTVREVLGQVPIVPAVVWKTIEDPLAYTNLESPVGSGAFALLEHTAEGRFVLRNTGMHHSMHASMAKLVVEIIRDESRALQALNEAKFDALAWDVAPTTAHNVQAHPEDYAGIQLASAAGMSVRSLWFNLRQAPYDNPELRLALALAIDRQALVDQGLSGFADQGTGDLAAPSAWWHDETIAGIPFDAQLATDKLTLAGFVDRDGDGLRESPDGRPLQILVTCAKTEAVLKTVELLIAQWKAVGIMAQASAVPAEQVLPTLMQAKFEVALHDLSLREPEDLFFYFHSSRGLSTGGRVSGYNYGGYANGDYDRIAELMQEEQDLQERVRLLRELQGILATDLPQIPLYSPRVLNLYRESRFAGWRPEPGVGLLSLETITRLVPVP